MSLTLPAGRIARAALLGVLAFALPPTTFAQKTGAVALELVVPFGPGGGADALGRATAKMLTGILGEPVQVSNVPGATGRQGIDKLIAAPADGRTLAVLTADTFTLQAYANPRWKLGDVIPLGIMMKQPSFCRATAPLRAGPSSRGKRGCTRAPCEWPSPDSAVRTT
jgi:tripartite-type tricarboxylate transporter receptor subunit TctC